MSFEKRLKPVVIQFISDDEIIDEVLKMIGLGIEYKGEVSFLLRRMKYDFNKHNSDKTITVGEGDRRADMVINACVSQLIAISEGYRQ